MDTELPSNIVREGFMVLASVGGPVLGVLLLIGLVIGILQSATQINDAAVGFLPRLAAGLIVVLMFGSWIMERLARYWVFALERISGGQ
jgi:flagellar biosynthetic protein FliQ